MQRVSNNVTRKHKQIVSLLHQINVIPEEIISLLIVSFDSKGGRIDSALCDTDINVETITFGNFIPFQIIKSDGYWYGKKKEYLSAIGNCIVTKGQIQTWKFQLLDKHNYLVIGIVDDANI